MPTNFYSLVFSGLPFPNSGNLCPGHFVPKQTYLLGLYDALLCVPQINIIFPNNLNQACTQTNKH